MKYLSLFSSFFTLFDFFCNFATGYIRLDFLPSQLDVFFHGGRRGGLRRAECGEVTKDEIMRSGLWVGNSPRHIKAFINALFETGRILQIYEL